MLIYRVCNAIEASHQRVGATWQEPLCEKEVQYVDAEGLYLTLFPEMWRRALNWQTKQKLQHDNVWDHTLLLEVDEESLVERRRFHYAGMEYRMVPTATAVVLGIAGPDWPPPEWVPQPAQEKDWCPTSCNYRDPSICYWVPRGVDPTSLWYHPSQPDQQAQRRQYALQLKISHVLGI